MHLCSPVVEAGVTVMCTYAHRLKGWGQQYCAPILVVEARVTVMCTYAH